MTTEQWRPQDGRPLTEHEREILTVFAEECLEVGKEAMAVGICVSKLLRFGADNTNPTTGLVNTDELCLEMGDLMVMMDRVARLRLFRPDKYEEGQQRKLKQLDRYLQTEPDPK